MALQSQGVALPPSLLTSQGRGHSPGYSSTYLAMGFANVRAGTQKRRGIAGRGHSRSDSVTGRSDTAMRRARRTRAQLQPMRPKSACASAVALMLWHGEAWQRRHGWLVTTRILGIGVRRPFHIFLIPNRVPHGFLPKIPVLFQTQWAVRGTTARRVSCEQVYGATGRAHLRGLLRGDGLYGGACTSTSTSISTRVPARPLANPIARRPNISASHSGTRALDAVIE